MPNIANLINKSNTKKLNNKQYIEFPRCNYINKATCRLKGKWQYELIVYKFKVYSSGPNSSSNNNSSNGKKYTWSLLKGLLKRYYNNSSFATRNIQV